MRRGHTSLTSSAVASMRAAASLTRGAACDPQDTLASQLLSPAAAGGLSLLAMAGPRLQRLAFGLGLGIGDHVALRSISIDAQLIKAVGEGIRQVVILGAGLDTRAHRLAALADCRVFEVDHPDTQQVKRQRAKALPVVAGALTHVSVDFAVEDLGHKLRDAGLDTQQQSFCICEGVVMYLPPDATSQLLGALAKLTPTGSQLTLTYACEDMVFLRHTRLIVLAVMRTLGEPLLGVTTPEQMCETLAAQGWRLREDTDTHDWAASHASSAPAGALIAYERMALATRR